MQLDLKGLNQHGTVFGIDGHPIRVAHAYQNHLGVMFDEGHYATFHNANDPSHPGHSAYSFMHAPTASDHKRVQSSYVATHATGHNADAGACLSSPAHLKPCQSANTSARSSDASSSAHASSTAAALATTSGHLSALYNAHSSLVPQRASFSFVGIDPNGSDAIVGRPAKQQRLC